MSKRKDFVDFEFRISVINPCRSGEKQSQFAIDVEVSGLTDEGMAILERTGRVTNPEDMLRVVEENKREWGLE